MSEVNHGPRHAPLRGTPRGCAFVGPRCPLRCPRRDAACRAFGVGARTHTVRDSRRFGLRHIRYTALDPVSLFTNPHGARNYALSRNPCTEPTPHITHCTHKSSIYCRIPTYRDERESRVLETEVETHAPNPRRHVCATARRPAPTRPRRPAAAPAAAPAAERQRAPRAVPLVLVLVLVLVPERPGMLSPDSAPSL